MNIIKIKCLPQTFVLLFLKELIEIITFSHTVDEVFFEGLKDKM